MLQGSFIFGEESSNPFLLRHSQTLIADLDKSASNDTIIVLVGVNKNHMQHLVDMMYLQPKLIPKEDVFGVRNLARKFSIDIKFTTKEDQTAVNAALETQRRTSLYPMISIDTSSSEFPSETSFETGISEISASVNTTPPSSRHITETSFPSKAQASKSIEVKQRRLKRSSSPPPISSRTRRSLNQEATLSPVPPEGPQPTVKPRSSQSPMVSLPFSVTEGLEGAKKRRLGNVV
jgi:hypothetical protein